MVGPDGTLAYPWLADGLASALQVDAHAVLLHGPAGIGQWELSVTLAQAWLCETDGPGKPCGQCASCRLVGARSHPDLMVLLPEALQESLGWGNGDDDAVAVEKSGKTRQPSKDIKVDAVRAAVGFAQTTSARGLGKVVVVHPAERLNGVAANALLKTLEEPPGKARFVLSSSAPDALLPTIRSRCQALPLGLPPQDQAVAWLESLGITQATVLLAATGGQPLEARAWVEQGVDAAAWSRVPRCVAQGDATPFAGWPMPRLIETLHKLCHDTMCVGCGAAPRYFPHESLIAGAKLVGLIEWSRALGRAARHAEHPFNAALMAESLVGQGQRAMASGARRHAAIQGVSVHSRA